MSKYREMSAKDLAFEKERREFRRQIKELECAKQMRIDQVIQLQLYVEHLENENIKLEDWNRRLLEFMDMESKDLESLLAREKEFKKLDNNLSLINFIVNMGQATTISRSHI